MQVNSATRNAYMSRNGLHVQTEFKAAMRRHPSGVTILTTIHGGCWFGMTATAVMSLSMEPPSLAVGVNRTASIHDPLLVEGTFCVNLLRSAQAKMCDAFSRRQSKDRFIAGEWEVDDVHGLPVLCGAQAHIFCHLESATPFGSHSLIVGSVIETRNDEAIDPLLYVNGAFATHGQV